MDADDGLADAGGRAVWAGLDGLELTTDAGQRRVAVFDADGTLWRGDVGDLHLAYLLKMGSVAVLDAWERYEGLCAEDVDAGYAFATTVMAGLEVGLVREAARAVWSRGLVEPLEPVMEMVQGLKERGWEVWVVSASNRWMVEEAVAGMGISAERVLGMETLVEGDRLGATLVGPITNGEGKVAAIRSRIGVQPSLAVGNSVHDGPMLSHAHLGVLVNGGPGPMSAELRGLADTSGWLCWELGDENA